MSKELTTITPEILEKKGEAWKTFGVTLTTEESKINIMAQQAADAIKVPTTFSEIPDAEDSLKTAKASLNVIEGKRKDITGKFDALKSRLMEPEKKLSEKVAEAEKSIIAIKKELEAQEKAKENAEKAEREYRVACETAKLKWMQAKKAQAQEWVINQYKSALDKQIPVDKIGDVIKTLKEKVSAMKDAAIEMPESNLPNADEIAAPHKTFHKDLLIEYYNNAIDATFVEYEIGLEDIQGALKRAAEKEEARKRKIEEETKAEEATVKLMAEAETMTPEVTIPTKALKKSYECEIEETYQGIIAIIAAFVANQDKCLQYLKVKKWSALTPKQMGTALAKVKTQDENFAPKGVNFQEISKL